MSGVRLHIAGSVAELRLDNPAKLNCFTVEMLGQLSSHLELIEGRSEVRAVIVTGEGEKAFCSGADINAWGGLSPADFARTWVRGGHRIFDRLARLGKPTIAALNGHAFGGGLELASACDIRVMTPKATIALPEAGVGIVPGWSGSQRLARLIPEAMVKKWRSSGAGSGQSGCSPAGSSLKWPRTPAPRRRRLPGRSPPCRPARPRSPRR